MKKLKFLVLPGEGIGPEITAATLLVLEKVIRRFKLMAEIELTEVGFQALAQFGTTIPDKIIAKAKAADGIVLGPLSHHDYPTVEEGGHNPSGVLRKQLDLFANLRPARTRTGIESPTGKTFDLIIVRENTEGFYADRSMFKGHGEFMPTEDVALSVRKITRKGCKRILQEAFQLAEQRQQKVTVVHKANVLRTSDGLFLEEAQKMAQNYPAITYEEQLIDSMAALLIRQPEKYDVVVTTNMFGDILSDEATELSGGLGLGAALNAGENHAMAQAQHGSAPDIAGKGIANPTSLMGSLAMLLRWLGQRRRSEQLAEAGNLIDQLIDRGLKHPSTRTADLDGQLNTKEFGQWVASQI